MLNQVHLQTVHRGQTYQAKAYQLYHHPDTLSGTVPGWLPCRYCKHKVCCGYSSHRAKNRLNIAREGSIDATTSFELASQADQDLRCATGSFICTVSGLLACQLIVKTPPCL